MKAISVNNTFVSFGYLKLTFVIIIVDYFENDVCNTDAV